MQLGDLVDALRTHDFGVSDFGEAHVVDVLVPPTRERSDAARHVEVTDVSFDARRTAPGDLFCCVPGTHTDGHDHASSALDAGAVALVVERALDLEAPQVVVSKVRRVMGPAASLVHQEPSRSLRVLGVTGTNGKTTTTYLLEAIGESAGLGSGVIGTIETRINGVPLAGGLTTPEAPDLQRLFAQMRDERVRMVAMEVSSHALDLGRVDGTWFAATAFLNLSHDHLDFHGSLDAYLEAKAKLFDPLRTAAAAINLDDAHGVGLAERARAGGLRVATFSATDTTAADVQARAVELSADGTHFVLVAPEWGIDGPIASPLVGSFNVANDLAAATTALLAGVDPAAVISGLEAGVQVPGRFERVDRGQGFTVLVDYAHTPDALMHALKAAREIASGRVLAVFGCGGDRDREKRPAMGRAAADGADVLYVTSDNPRSEDPQAIIDQILEGVPAGTVTLADPDRRAAIRSAIADARAGDVVIIAGKGHEAGQTIGDSVRPFDDRAVAAQVLEQMR